MQGQGMYRGDGQGGDWHACGTNKLHLLDVQQVSSSDIPFPAKGYAANAFADDHPVARLEFVGSSSLQSLSVSDDALHRPPLPQSAVTGTTLYLSRPTHLGTV